LRGALRLGHALVDRLLVGLELLAQQLDAPARLVVVEQLGARGRRRGRGEQDEEREAPHQYSPL